MNPWGIKYQLNQHLTATAGDSTCEDAIRSIKRHKARAQAKWMQSMAYLDRRSQLYGVHKHVSQQHANTIGGSSAQFYSEDRFPPDIQGSRGWVKKWRQQATSLCKGKPAKSAFTSATRDVF